MFDRSFYPEYYPPPRELDEVEMLVLAGSVLHVHRSKLSVHLGLRVVSCQLSPGRYAYVKFDNDGEMEVFHPRNHHQHPRRVQC